LSLLRLPVPPLRENHIENNMSREVGKAWGTPVSFLVLQSSLSRERRDFLFELFVPLVFAIPLVIFSVPGGYFADRFSKRSGRYV
jgi:hypothetical protein